MNDLTELTKRLVSLDDKELVKVFYGALSKRKIINNDFSSIDDAYVIGIGGYIKENGNKTEIEVLALSKDDSPSANYDDFLKDGQCVNCKLVVRSRSKIAICPICEFEIECI